MTLRTDGYVPIESYALLGDGRSTALVSTDGRIDWWPVEALDAPPSFAALLDPEAGGHIGMAPDSEFTVSRRYLPDTNVLETTFSTDTGTVKVTDALPLGVSGRLAWCELVRRVEGIDGTVSMSWSIEPGTQFGAVRPWADRHRDAAVIHVGDVHVAVRTFDVGEPTIDGHRVRGTFTAEAGSSGLVAIVGGVNAPVFFADRDVIERHLDLTVERWREWSDRIAYDGRWSEPVRRSALALKQLMYSPTGAIVAAPTTSLPERIGGPKNWDYRFMWVRDCSFSIDALSTLQLHDEVQAAVQWMLGALRSTAPDLHVFYTLEGGAPEPEQCLDVPGYRRSQPVRAGNGAADQVQLGNFGDLFDTIWQYVDAGHCLDPASSDLLAELADRCCDVWLTEDSGIWELQDQHHYTISKIGCWTALDRAVRLQAEGQLTTGHVERWEQERDRITSWVNANCWSTSKQAYTFYAGTDKLDAATLLAARTGFDRGERLASTVAAIRDELTDGAAVYRYSGAKDEEGAFIACSFWLVNALVVTGDLDAAADLMDAAVALANDVGLFAEQIDPTSGAALGNFPQGLSHLTLINAACAFQDAVSRRDGS